MHPYIKPPEVGWNEENQRNKYRQVRRALQVVGFVGFGETKQIAKVGPDNYLRKVAGFE